MEKNYAFKVRTHTHIYTHILKMQSWYIDRNYRIAIWTWIAFHALTKYDFVWTWPQKPNLTFDTHP